MKRFRHLALPGWVMQLLLVAAICGVPILLVLSARLLTAEFEQSRRLRDQVSQSFQTRVALERLLRLHLDLETAQRGYMLARDPSFLDPYARAQTQIDQAFANLVESLDADSPATSHIEELKAQSMRKREFATRMIALSRSGHGEEARAIVASGEGRRIMDRFRAMVAQIDAQESARLEARVARSEQGRRQLRGRMLVLQTVLFLLLIGAALVAVRIDLARRRTMRALEHAKTRQEAIFDSAQDGMLMLDTKGAIENLNPSAAAMFGYAQRELPGQNVGMLFKNKPDPQRVEAVLRAIQREGGPTQEYVACRKDESDFPVEVSISPVRDSDHVSYLAVIRDITERKQIDRMKGEFISIVSHELRTPLTSIAGSLGLLAGGAAGELPERARRLTAIAHTNTSRLVRMVNDILDLEKMSSGKTVIERVPVPLAPVIERTVQELQAYATDYGVTIVADPVPPGAAVLAAEDPFANVLTNLLGNAIKFSPMGESVRIAVSERGDQYRITVSDHGPGIPEHLRGRVFERFVQADSSDTRQKGGSGLGLSIVADIVRLLKGTVSFDSELGKGTSFHVDLARAEPMEIAAK
ncbi:MAG: CHASE3 domain-containing protein [Sphingomonas sp.]|uniref:sensor histidine kinase n=1 Tax=Sphingomonas sp. TaxID=28214 RepID=UPI001B2536F8|nr:CHASE3 domain-containing protein [Sphingomonas sp.]MBO9624302.1 CHASE3 domain-containing protein [Sphingomonas sp.]